MRCSRCQINTAKYTVDYTENTGIKTQKYLCEVCYKQSLSNGENAERVIPMSESSCPFCGNRMEDYLCTGLVGCAECYAFFRQELADYVVRLQGNGEHRGKEPSKDPKYEAAQSLRELLVRQKQAEREGNEALALKFRRNVEELKLVLFDDEEE